MRCRSGCEGFQGDLAACWQIVRGENGCHGEIQPVLPEGWNEEDYD